jgi:hypothetical protein
MRSSWCPPLTGGREGMSVRRERLHPRSRRRCGWPALGLVAATIGCGGSEPTRVPTPVSTPVAVTTPVPVPTATPTPAATISFLRSTPEPGSGVPTIRCYGNEFCADLEASFEVSSPVDRSGLKFDAEVLTSAGSSCGEVYGKIPDLRAGRAANAVLNRWELYGGSGCPLFTRSSTTQATAFIEVNLHEEFKQVRRARFEVPYTFLAPPLSAEPTAPEVVKFCWRKSPNDHNAWGAMPAAGDDIEYLCSGEDPDGDAVSVSIDYESADGCLTADHCWTSTRDNLPRAVPLSVIGGTVRKSPGGAFSVTCRMRDSHGFEARRTIRNDQGCNYPYPYP